MNTFKKIMAIVLATIVLTFTFVTAIAEGTTDDIGNRKRERPTAEERIRNHKSLEEELQRFRHRIKTDGIMAEQRKREDYERPSVKRPKKSEAAPMSRRVEIERRRFEEIERHRRELEQRV